jgi:hypothetical protein
MEPLRIKHTYNSGDLITILVGLKHLYETTGKKSIIMQVLGFKAFYYDGCIHSVKNEQGEDVTMNQKMWDMLVPLLEEQSYIESVEVWRGQPYDISFDETRDRRSIPMPAGSIHHWPFFLVPELQCDLSDAWISCAAYETCYEGKIIVNRTERYRNPYMNYFFLKQYEKDVVFAGTKKEYELFCSEYDLNIQYLEVDDFYELAAFLNACKLFIGNQSFCWHLADSMKITRILEVCSQFPNTFPTGANGYAVIYQQALELYVHKLFNK